VGLAGLETLLEPGSDVTPSVEAGCEKQRQTIGVDAVTALYRLSNFVGWLLQV
jgi:hypothetical protein